MVGAEPASAETPRYRDAGLSTAERVDDLLDRMTLAEKVGQMLQLDARGPIGPLVTEKLVGSLLHASPATIVEAQSLASRTRLGIPLLMADDCIHGYSFWPGATIFPSQLAMACTWDVELLERVARATAREVSTTGLHWTFSPVLCITRDLRWGRVNETFGEDPELIGALGAAMVRGYQGDGLHDRSAILATAKHFAGYSETQGGRDASEADLSERKLRSWFLPPFERVVAEGCRTVMIGYQAIDGVPITANRWLLNDVLKEEWGFAGTLVTDWDNVGRMVWEQRVCASDTEAAAVAVTAGNDFIMNTPQFFEAAQEAVEQGALSVALIDDAVRRILALKFDLGLFEDPRLPDEEEQREVIACDDHRLLNLEVARSALTLLRNDGSLPVSGLARRVLVVGPNADDPHAQLGDWAGASGQIDWMPDGHPRATVETVLDGLRALAPAEWNVDYCEGARIGTLAPNPDGETYLDGQPRPPVFLPARIDDALVDEAVAAAAKAEVVVAVIGDTVALTGEGRSTATLELQGTQVALVEALLDAGATVVIVLIQSKPSVLPPSFERAAAIVQAFNPGMRGGYAIAELLLGLIEPSGRLPLSVARHVGQQPVYYNRIRGQHGDRYADLTQEPLFAFGEGLSYTKIEYSDLELEQPVLRRDGEVRARVRLRNTGVRPAVETVQAYIADTVTSVTWAEKELKAFRRILVRPGEEVVVSLNIPVEACTIVDAHGRRIVEPGAFELLVGPSSRDAALLRQTFTVS